LLSVLSLDLPLATSKSRRLEVSFYTVDLSNLGRAPYGAM